MYSPRILFVEDHQDTLDLFEVVLSELKYQVVTASSVERALELAGSQPFDIFVLDSWLTDGSGIDLCKQIRLTDRTTPILFCSGKAYEKDKEEALVAGAQGYLTKPVDISELGETIANLISEYRRLAAPLSQDVSRADSGNLAVSVISI
jgi:two-component system, OmpR family, alkaline phosphatase synthesis response regulator PhoP